MITNIKFPPLGARIVKSSALSKEQEYTFYLEALKGNMM